MAGLCTSERVKMYWKYVDWRDIHMFPVRYTKLSYQQDSMELSVFWISFKTA